MEKENTIEENVNQNAENAKGKVKKSKKEKAPKNKNKIDGMEIAKKVLAFCAILLMILPICASLIYTIISA